jgi:hypothetical protein
MTGSFTPTGSMTTAREDHTATALSDGRVLIAGAGYAELYDPVTGSFPTCPVTDRQLEAACNGRAIPAAAKYTGKTHPLVVVYRATGWTLDATAYDINIRWYGNGWSARSSLSSALVPRST